MDSIVEAIVGSLCKELERFFGAEGVGPVMRRAGRAAGYAAHQSGVGLPGPTDPLPAAWPVVLQPEGSGFRACGADLCPGIANWSAGFLEGLAADAKNWTASTHDPTLLLPGEGTLSNGDSTQFRLPTTGPLPPSQLAFLAASSSDAVLFIDRDNRIRSWNRGAEAMFGYTEEEAHGTYFDLLVPQELRESGELEALATQTERQGSIRNYITERVAKDGMRLTVSLSRTLTRSEDGTVIGSSAILRDITDQHRLERELEEARHLAGIGELASQVAHEVRNPLAGIHGALQILQRRMQPSAEETAVFAEVSTEISRLDRLVSELLTFARPIRPATTALPLHDYLEDWLQRHQAQLEGREAVVTLAINRAATVRADAALLDQILANLLTNAVDAAGPGCRIALTLDRHDSHPCIRFADNGPGIPDSLRARVIQPFFTTKSRGTGLGLAVCAKHMRAVRGSLAILDADKGLTVELRFEEADPSSPDRTSRSGNGSGRD